MKYLFTFFTLVLLTAAQAQFSYVRKTPFPKTSGCSLLRDSTIDFRVDNIYNTGKSYNCYTYYTYDVSGRKTSLLSNCESGKTWYFYYPQNQTPYADSVVYTYGGITRISAFDYDTDSILTSERLYYTDKGFPELDRDFRYSKQIDGSKLMLTQKDILHDTSIGDGYSRITLENGLERIKEGQSRNVTESQIIFRRTFQTLNSDTIINYRFDSTVSKTNPQDIRVTQDSAVTIRSHHTGFDVLTTKSKSNGIVYGNPQIFQNWRSIDTVYPDGSSINYYGSIESGILSPSSKVIMRRGGNEKVSYQYKENKWIPTYKEERYFMDAERRCEGQFFYYTWINNQWVLDIQSTHYYQGRTVNRSSLENLPCKIVNPFAAPYSLNCDALITDEKYSLTIVDLDGQIVFKQDFKADQQLTGIDMLKKDRLYFFIIHSDSGKVVTRKKIFLSN